MDHSFLVIGFITLVAPVTGVATLGSIAMEESTTGNGSASSLLDLYNFYLRYCYTFGKCKGEYNSMPYLTIIISAIVILVILHLINFKSV